MVRSGDIKIQNRFSHCEKVNFSGVRLFLGADLLRLDKMVWCHEVLKEFLRWDKFWEGRGGGGG